MSNLTLRLAAREIFAEALRAVDATAAVQRAVRLEGARLNICDMTIEIGDRNIYSIAIGKAAFAMASALEGILDEKLTAGVISSNAQRYGTARTDAGDAPAGMPVLPPRHSVFHGGHPEPNEQSLAAAQACFDLLDRANQEHALVIFLISGGGSALIEWPIRQDITLSDLRSANKTLVNSGAAITEVNAVRRSFSAVKGGRLAARAANCDQITLIVSDVPAGEDHNVASGPTLNPAADDPNARAVIAQYNLQAKLPETILRTIESEAPPDNFSASLRRHFVLLDNDKALEAAANAARRHGFVTRIAAGISDQPIDKGCAALVNSLGEIRGELNRTATKNAETVICLLSGGEFACPVKGDGLGGRNLETALRLAGSPALGWAAGKQFVALCAGTDGIDGNSPAAGAIVDETTITRARAIGLEPEDFLKRSDAYSFFVALGDAVAIGATGTNVRDLRIILATP
jgi:glycerate 2-kinase